MATKVVMDSEDTGPRVSPLSVITRLGRGAWTQATGAVLLLVTITLTVFFLPWDNPGSPSWYSPRTLVTPLAHNLSWLAPLSRPPSHLETIRSFKNVGLGTAVAFAPNGINLAVAGRDGTVAIFEGMNGNFTQFLRPGPVWSIAFAPDGKTLASAVGDGKIVIDEIDGNRQTPLVGHKGAVLSVAFALDGTRLASGGEDAQVLMWDLNGKELLALSGHSNRVRSVAFSPDSQTIVSGGDDRMLGMWDVNGKGRGLRDGGVGPIYSVAFAPDGQSFIFAGQDGTVRQWSLAGEEIRKFDSHGLEIFAVAVAQDGKTFVSGGNDGTVRLWDIAGGQIASVEHPRNPVLSVAYSADGRIAAGFSDGRIEFLKARTSYVLPAPWTWAGTGLGLAFLFLLGTAYRNAHAEIYDELTATKQPLPAAAAFLDSEGPIDDPKLAGKAMNALCGRLSYFIRNRSTATPITFAIAGEWGSGKSSVMRLVQADLEAKGFPNVWFNAWHHQGEEQLFAALMESIRIEAIPSLLSAEAYSLRHLSFRARLLFLRISGDPFRYALRIAIAVFVIALIWYLLPAGKLDQLPKEFSFLALAKSGLLNAVASILAVWFAVRDLIMPFMTEPAALLQKAEGWLSFRRFTDRLSFRENFASAFREVCSALGDRRLTILIDDLDRCRPDRVVEVLEAINFLTTNGDCFIMLGISEGPVKAAVGLSFKEIADERAHALAALSGGAAPDGYAARKDYADRYLEKLVTLRAAVPAFDSQALQEWLGRGGLKPREHNGHALNWKWAIPFVIAVAVCGFASVELAKNLSPLIIADTHAPAAGGSTENLPPPLSTTTAAAGGATSQSANSAAPVQVQVRPASTVQPAQPAAGSGTDWVALMPWFALAFASLGAAMFADPRLRKYTLNSLTNIENGIVDDSEAYRKAFGDWVPLVLKARNSPRAVKRFANRLRFLTAGLSDTDGGKIAHLIAIGALHEASIVAPSGIPSKSTLNSAKTALKVFEPTPVMLKALDTLGSSDWTDYWALESGTAAPSGPTTGASKAS